MDCVTQDDAPALDWSSLRDRSCLQEQEALHREFCGLFEGFTSGFLEARGVSEAEFGKGTRIQPAAACHLWSSLTDCLCV